MKTFKVERWDDGEWKLLASGTTIGYKRILRFDPIETEKMRVTITEARACPLISNLEVY